MSVRDRHSATATLDGSPLAVESIDVTMDRKWAPYVQGRIVCAGYVPETDGRATITLTQRFADGLTAQQIADTFTDDASTIEGVWTGTAQQIARTYQTPLNGSYIAPTRFAADLAVRGMSYDIRSDRTTISVASEEAVAQDVALVSSSPVGMSTLSVRTAVTQALALMGAALVDGDADAEMEETPVMYPGQSIDDFCAPLVQQGGLRLYADEKRAWHLVDAETNLPGAIALSTFRDVSEASLTADREAGGYDAVVIEYQWNAAGVANTAWDVAGPTRPRKVLKLVYGDTIYPGPGAAKHVLKRMMRTRLTVPISAVANYTTRPTMAVSLTSAALPNQSGRISRVSFAFSRQSGSMTVNAYDLESISARSVRAIPAGIRTDDLTGTTADLEPGSM